MLKTRENLKNKIEKEIQPIVYSFLKLISKIQEERKQNELTMIELKKK